MLLIKQFDDNDCGAACIAMICNHYKSFNTITHKKTILVSSKHELPLRYMNPNKVTSLIKKWTK